METELQIKNKNKLKRIFKTIGSLKKWTIVMDITSEKWFMYHRGELLIKVEGKFSEDIIELIVLVPIFSEVNTAVEIFLRPLVSEKDVRDLIKKDSLILQNETIYYIKTVILKANTKNLTAVLIEHINQISNTCDNLAQVVQAKADFISEINLN